MRASIQRLLTAAILITWMAPVFGVLGLYLHVAADHHGAPRADHSSEISDLLKAATHGHHHEADAATRHEHDVRIESAAPAIRSGSPLVADFVVPAVSPSGPSARSLQDGSLRRAPPDPLFATNCSLLL